MNKKRKKPSDIIEGKVLRFFDYQDRGMYREEDIRWKKLLEYLDEEFGK